MRKKFYLPACRDTAFTTPAVVRAPDDIFHLRPISTVLSSPLFFSCILFFSSFNPSAPAGSVCCSVPETDAERARCWAAGASEPTGSVLSVPPLCPFSPFHAPFFYFSPTLARGLAPRVSNWIFRTFVRVIFYAVHCLLL